MNINSCFSIALNEIKDSEGVQGKNGMPEFAGPNMKIINLPEVAIIHMGKLKMEDTYSGNE